MIVAFIVVAFRACVRVYIAINDIKKLTNIKRRLNNNSTFVDVTGLLIVQRYSSIAQSRIPAE